MSSRAMQSEFLEQRIAENTAAQEIDLGSWIFDRLLVRPQDHILELCCGTGAQSLRFIELLGNSGTLSAVDVSADSLKALVAKLPTRVSGRIRPIEADIDDLSGSLEKSLMPRPAFDLVFCAYGLYYSADPIALLDEIRLWLKPEGRIAIVGPFGPNNRQLFEIVQASGAVLPSDVIESSQRFMLEQVVPWGATNFDSVSLHTMVNRVRWTSTERVLNYWQNTTFFDSKALPVFESLLRKHFEVYSQFVNEKWVMMAEMTNARA
jgi:ubiquinone/menaquinone biosynthesis C-methylase UbiE